MGALLVGVGTTLPTREQQLISLFNTLFRCRDSNLDKIDGGNVKQFQPKPPVVDLLASRPQPRALAGSSVQQEEYKYRVYRGRVQVYYRIEGKCGFPVDSR